MAARGSRRVGEDEQERTVRARAAVVAAATDRFVAHGYAATSIGQISADSGVPSATVYRLFATKLGILSAAMDVAIAGDADPVPVAQRPVVEAALADETPRGKVAGFVSIMVAINQRISALYWVVFRAADVDEGARDLLHSLDSQRSRGQRQLARALDESGALAPGMSLPEAEDLIHALMSPETFRLLVTQRGWSPDRYADWLTDVLTHQLLG
ncbi:TetR/AcrR family transcriptional regulator [Nocardioides sp. GXZ039]|uniref:TetR/AcrR family transcriptional regulator n=1 Tax=Nocardioides sp. GXZ039 TaxID=3136018 RepID=UPI0030F3A3A8